MSVWKPIERIERIERALAIAASITCLCACGARSALETSELSSSGTTSTTSTTASSCHEDPDAGTPSTYRGCVLRAYDPQGAILDVTTLDVPEPPVEGYWVGNIAIVGSGEGAWFQLWADKIEALGCGMSFPLQPYWTEQFVNQVFLRWAQANGEWTSAAGTMEVIAYQPGGELSQRPIHVEIHGARMEPHPETSSGATGSFSLDLSCRLDRFFGG